MKDYIDIMTGGMNKQRMEIVTIFKLEGFPFKYMIYCTLNKEHYYLAKFKGEDIVDLNTDFSDREYKLCKKIFEGVTEHAIGD